MINQTVDFTFEYLGNSWEVDATFERFSETGSADGDHEWEMKDINVIGGDDCCYYSEFKQHFVCKWASTEMVSVASLIEAEAEEKLE